MGSPGTLAYILSTPLFRPGFPGGPVSLAYLQLQIMHHPKLLRSAVLLASASTASVFAQNTTTWTGSANTSFNAAGNWSNNLPSATNTAVFDSSSANNLSAISVAPNIAPVGITVTGPASSVGIVINGTAAILNVGSGGITLNGTRDLTVTKGTSTSAGFLGASASQDWNVSPGRTLGISTTGEYDLITSGVTVTMKGGGAVNVTATNFDIGQTNSNTVVVGGVALTTSGGIRLGQNNAGVGNLTINSGSVNVGTILQFGSGTGASGNLVVQGGSTLRAAQIVTVSGAGASTATFDGATLRGIAPDVNLIGTGNFTTSIGAGGLTVDTSSSNNVTIAGVMGDKSGAAGMLTKSGAGLLTLAAANTFTGNTTVSAGTLALGANGSLASTAYSVANGATFDVSAKTAGGYNLSGVNLTLGAGSGTSGFFNAGTAALTFGGGLTVNFSTAAAVASYNLFDFGSQSGDFSSVTFAGSLNGSLVLSSADTWTGTFGGHDWTLDERTGVLSSVSAIPEPSSIVLLAGLAGMGSAGIRRRRRA